MKHPSAFTEIGPCWRKKRRDERIDASFGVKETFGSAHVWTINAIAEAELVHLFATIFNVLRVCCKWKLIAVVHS